MRNFSCSMIYLGAFVLTCIGANFSAQAQGVSVRGEVLPPKVGAFDWLNTDVEGTKPITSGVFSVYITPKCFPSNLRIVAHPVRETSQLTLTLRYFDSSNNQHDVTVSYPAWVHFGGFPNVLLDNTTPAPRNVSVSCPTCPQPPRAYAWNGSLTLQLQGARVFNPDPVTGLYNFPSTGTGVSNIRDFLQFVNLTQTLAGTAVTLPVSLQRSATLGPDLRSASVELRVGGGDGFSNLWWGEVQALINQGLNPCFAFISPLMLFFDDKIPQFKGNVRFPLANPQDPSHYFWPEKNAPGYFLALDKNKNGKIDSGEELFGNNNSSSNGFHDLAKHDSNKDGVIDEKDEIFGQLRLWQDKNSDGVSQKAELFSLASKKVKSIRLNYEKRVMKIGKRAEIRQSAKFEFANAKGEAQTGDVHDIWFAPGKP